MNLFLLLFLLLVAGAGYVLFNSYNALRRLAEEVKESFSNISIVTRKKTALINQLITLVGNYAESEKFVMLKLANDSTQALQHVNVSSGLVLAEIGRMAQRFPELKSNQQYNRLMDSVNLCERDVQNSRLTYNERARRYNSLRSALPTVFYATTVGFGPAEYLSLQADELEDAGIQKAPITEDSQRLNDLLGSAGKKTFATLRDAQQQGREWIEKNAAPRLPGQIAAVQEEVDSSAAPAAGSSEKTAGA